MALLIAARDGDEALADTEVRDQVLIFLLAGHDTTAIALAFALYLLGHHRNAQERVREEVAEVAGDRTPGAADVERLTYTTMMLKEAMRLYPPAWAAGRPATTSSPASPTMSRSPPHHPASGRAGAQPADAAR
jgi:cytochrome P450